jgi:hypothetical protein
MGRTAWNVFVYLVGLALAHGSLGWLSPSACAETFSLDLSSPNYFDLSRSTGLWNTVSTRIQAASAPGSTAGEETNFGDGRHGVFFNGASVAGITMSGATIRIDASAQSSYQFTSFTLSAGYTLNVVGNAPLVIRVLGPTTIAGTVVATPTTGNGNGTAGAGNQITSSIPGGTGILGSGAGGNAGATSSGASTTGGSPSANALGGAGGTNSAVSGSYQAGGGGCNGIGNNAPDTAYDAAGGFNGSLAGACALTHTQIANTFTESIFVSGAGGGGGGAFTPGVAANRVGGSGGGGGGGAIRIASLGTMTVTGTISAVGGNGGTNNADGNGTATNCGGGGGGGSGGSIWLQTLGSIVGAGVVNITGGTGATSATCGAGYAGGNGSRGIYRADTVDGTNSIQTSGTVTPSALTDNPETMGIPNAQSYVVYTKPILFDAEYDFVSAEETIGCGLNGSLNVVYQGSDDGYTFAQTARAGNIELLSNFAYIRMIITITTTGANPPCLTGLKLNFNYREFTDLKMRGGLFCGSLSTGPRPPRDALGDFLVLALALILIRLTGRWPTSASLRQSA